MPAVHDPVEPVFNSFHERPAWTVVVEHEEDAAYLRDFVGVRAIALTESLRIEAQLPRGPGSEVLLVGTAAHRCARQFRELGVSATWGAHLPPGHVCVSHYLEERAKVVGYVLGQPELLQLWRVIEDSAFEIKPITNGVSVDGVDSVNSVSGVDTARPFPVNCLPPACRSFVLAGAAAQGVDPAFYATPLLAILAGAIGNSRRAQLKGNYYEPSVLWTCVVAPSGSGKSPALHAVQQPIRERDFELHEQTERDLQRHERDILLWEAAKKAALGGKAPEPPSKPVPPPLRAVLVEDITVEALADRLLENPRGLLLAVDELAGWFNSFNSYKARGNDEQKWLQIYSAAPTKIDRKATSGARKRVYVPRAAVSITGTIQPDVARRVLDRAKRESGMASRILLASPKIHDVVWTEATIPDDVNKGYGRVVRSLLDLTETDPPLSLTLSPDARAVWISFYNRNGSLCATAARSGNQDMNSVLSKIRGVAPRIALALALAKAAENGMAELLRVIDADAMRSGIEIAEWFAQQAALLYRQWDVENAGEPRDIVDFIASLLPKFGGVISVRELQRSSRRFRSVNEATDALQSLVDAGLGEWQRIPARNGQTVRKFTLRVHPVDAADTVDAVDADAVLEVGQVQIDSDAGSRPSAPPESASSEGRTPADGAS